MKSRLLYAAYGSNLHPGRLQERIASATLVGTSLLSKYGLRFHKRGMDRSAKCGLSNHGEGVHVAVYEIGSGDKRVLDQIEGVGKGYDAGVVEAPGFGSCHTYFASETHIDDQLQPFDWYKEMVLLGCLTHAFPGAYCERIAALPAIVDRDQRRARQNWHIVGRLRACN